MRVGDMAEFSRHLGGEGDVPTFSQGVKDCIPTLIGYISIGVAMGIVGVSSNLSVLEVALLAAFVYAGAAQFIVCALLLTASPFLVIVFTTFIVNLRHLLLSMALAPSFTKYSLLKNIGIGTLVTDETFGVTIHKIMNREPVSDRWMIGLNLTAYGFWILSCVTGAVFGRWISNPEVFGLDFALTAMFLALLVLQLQHVRNGKLKLYLSLILYVVISMLVLSVFVPSYIAIMISTVIVAAIGVLTDR